MEASNPFTSYESLRAWFKTKIDPLESQKQTFTPCSECCDAIERCPNCFRKYNIIEMDLAKWTTLEAQELYFFNYPKAALIEPEFQQLYWKKTATIWNEIDRLSTANPQKTGLQKEKADTQEDLINIREIAIDSPRKEVRVMIADLVEQLEDLDRCFDMEDAILKAKGWILSIGSFSTA